MARPSKAQSTTSKQKTLKCFFSSGSDLKNKGKTKNESRSDEEPEDIVDDDDQAEVPKGAAPDMSNLPPINKIPEIFSDLVSHIPEIKDVAELIQGRKLRVATMCSGTESPLLALDLICQSILAQHGVKMEIDHVFSCEIEPFKQAYIERNFHPPLLFRDVCELGDGYATTAYGALAQVPGNVDLLVAGTSCVDYSNLNNEKQDLEANGESGRTFRGMMSWVTAHRPPIVILENVCSAPWPRVQEKFEMEGYSATFLRLDTKQFYIPHTRTRVYLFAVNKRSSSKIPEKWEELITNKLKRPASASLDSFLLASDDPRIQQSREKLVQEIARSADRKSGRTDWARCQSRHERTRLEMELGAKRPLTGWDEGGSCKLPDYAWNDWGRGQVERVWDEMDILFLQAAQEGVDASYKTQVWNLSQNVDRINVPKWGISPCLTPSMIPFVTNRGGPMVGLEALSMQGLPVDRLLLTRETEDNLADLAGNAMTSTVVGACILAALVAGKGLIKSGNDQESYEIKNHGKEEIPDQDDEMLVDGKADPATIPIEEHIIGDDQLVSRTLNSSHSSDYSLSDLLREATRSVRLCTCEGRKDVFERPFQRCVDCGLTVCRRCAGRPEHNHQLINLAANPRLHPLDFAKILKAALPMSLNIPGVSQELLDDMKKSHSLEIPGKRWSTWSAAVVRATQMELRFVEPKRQDIWSAMYESPTAILELIFHPQQTKWRLYAKAEAHEPANSEIRRLLRSPVARFVCKGALLKGQWEFALPSTTTVNIKISATGPQVDSWGKRLGLQDLGHKESTVASQLRIEVPQEDRKKFDRDIDGIYTLLDKCGTANSALHKKQSAADDALPPLFMLLDPTRTGDSKDDSFVFSITIKRLEFGESRPIVCRLDSSWRQSSSAETREIPCHISCKWVLATSAKLEPSSGQRANFSVPGDSLSVSASYDSCSSATAMLLAEVDLRSQAGPEWPRGHWTEVDRINERETYRALSFFTERIRNIDDRYQEWQAVAQPSDADSKSLCRCERCAPAPPTLQWAKQSNKIVPVENQSEAGEYERRLKRRPPPFVTQLKLDEETSIGHVRLGVNVASLLHRAASRLPSRSLNTLRTLAWRLNTNFVPLAKLPPPKFYLKSNKQDREHEQPPHFKIPLRHEQLRSLEWMLKQESVSAAPFIEEEISEAILEPLGWRAEGRAQQEIKVRGGVLADQVGYGKTAITLGLVDCAAKNIKTEFKEMDKELKGKIAVRATLVVVPPHLTKQWKSEAEKFAGNHFKVVLISTMANIRKLRISDIQKADLVIVASNIVKSKVYQDVLTAFAAGGDLPAQDGRYFNARFDKVLESLATQVDRLRDEGPEAVMKQILEARKREEDGHSEAFVPTKRLKGKQYRDAADAAEAAAATVKKTNELIDAGIRKMAKLQVSPLRKNRAEVFIQVSPPKGYESLEASFRRSPPRPLHMDVDQDDEEDDTKIVRGKRSTRAKRPVFIDDEDEGEDEAMMSTGDSDAHVAKKRKTSRASSRSVKSSDDEDFIVVSDDSDEEKVSDDVFEDSEDEDLKPRKRSAAKAKPSKPARSAKGKQSRATDTSEAEENGDVEDEKPKKKRKAVAKPTKPKTRVELSDPWGLKSRAVKSDWTEMTSPLLEMFHFARKVIDEYTYLDGSTRLMHTKVSADRKWVLSGTPPVHSFPEVKTIAAFLDIHLGVDDDGDVISKDDKEEKKKRREQTAVEKFHSFREVHSLEWHAHRRELGQRFLDQFVRQNIAEIDEIPWSEKIEKNELPAAERAIYLELEHFLRGLDMKIQRKKKSESDRDVRLAKALGESKSAEEALLKRCSHFDLETTDEENAMKACEVIVKERKKQLEDCRQDLLQRIEEAYKEELAISKILGSSAEESLFKEWVRVSWTEGHDDHDATEAIQELLKEAGVAKVKAAGGETRNKNARKDDMSGSMKTRVWEHREATHVIRRIAKELTARLRSLRYFTAVRDLQSEKTPEVSCPGCGRTKIPINEVAALSSCGHMGCLSCVTRCAGQELCVYAESGKCKAPARVTNIVEGKYLGVDDERDGKGRHFGRKLEKVVELIKTRIPKNDRILVFVQFADLTAKVAEAFKAHGISFLEIRGTATQKANTLEKYQNDSKERVLLLNYTNESASGANLTGANHAIFLSPLLTTSQAEYDAQETQAIGRLRRYGQKKHVHIWRFLSANTIDEIIYEERTDGKKREEEAARAEDDEVMIVDEDE